MTDKPLSERIRERVEALEMRDVGLAAARGDMDAVRAYAMQAETLGFLAELAEMMEKK